MWNMAPYSDPVILVEGTFGCNAYIKDYIILEVGNVNNGIH